MSVKSNPRPKNKLPIWVHGHLKKWLADPNDPLSGSSFQYIVAYKTTEEIVDYDDLELACLDFGFSQHELDSLSAREMAEQVIARGVLTAKEMRELEEDDEY